MYINRSEYLFYGLLKMSGTHLCHATKIKKLHIILLRLLRKTEQNRRLPNHLSFYRLWICLCWCTSGFSCTSSQVFSFADQGFEKVVFNMERYMILKNIQIYCSQRQIQGRRAPFFLQSLVCLFFCDHFEEL